MKVSDAYRGNYVSVERWPTTPEVHTITGAGIEDDPFSNAQGALLIFVQFDNHEEKYRINKSNAAELVTAWGDDIEAWNKMKVTIHRVQAQIRGRKGWQGMITPVKGKAGKKSPKS